MKRPFRAKSVAASLDKPEGHLKLLLEKANRLQSVSQSIGDYLPEDLRAHCKVGAIDNNVLTLYVDSAAWANRVRYQSSDLIPKLRENLYPSLVSIEVKVKPQ